MVLQGWFNQREKLLPHSLESSWTSNSVIQLWVYQGVGWVRVGPMSLWNYIATNWLVLSYSILWDKVHVTSKEVPDIQTHKMTREVQNTHSSGSSALTLNRFEMSRRHPFFLFVGIKCLLLGHKQGWNGWPKQIVPGFCWVTKCVEKAKNIWKIWWKLIRIRFVRWL